MILSFRTAEPMGPRGIWEGPGDPKPREQSMEMRVVLASIGAL